MFYNPKVLFLGGGGGGNPCACGAALGCGCTGILMFTPGGGKGLAGGS